MNQEQRNYALGRITFMTDTKVKEITEKFTSPAVKLSFDEKVALVRNRKVLLTPSKIDKYDHLDDIFDFSKYEKKEAFNEAKAKPTITMIRDRATKVRDKIMLAEGMEALAAIEEFEKFIAREHVVCPPPRQ